LGRFTEGAEIKPALVIYLDQAKKCAIKAQPLKRKKASNMN
jgi:hypothetical protein